MKDKLLSEGNKVPRTEFEARQVAGSATYQQSKTVWGCVVLQGRFVYFVYSLVKTKGVCLFSFLVSE